MKTNRNEQKLRKKKFSFHSFLHMKKLRPINVENMS